MKKNCIFYVLMLLAMMCTRSYASPATDCSICDPDTDYQALRQLYLDTDGDSWTDNTNWPDAATLSANPNSPPSGHVSMGTWYGVKTNSAGCVTRLSLQSNQLSGSLPQEIGNLSYLTRLYLHTNQLGSSIPPEIGDLSNLTILNMRANQFTGNIPTTIGNLNALESLNLGVNQLDGGIPLTIGNLINLRSLLLNNNQLNGGIPSVIGNLSALESFYVHYNQFSGPVPPTIGNLGNLNQIWLAHNQLSGCYDTNLSTLCNQLTYSSNARISDGNNFDAAWEDFCDFGQGACLPADICPVPDTFMLKPGDAFVTCYSEANPTLPVAGIKNVDEIEPGNMATGIDLSSSLSTGEMFTYNQIGGEVFGTCFDNAGAIYVTATTLYGYDGNSFSGLNHYGYASIVKIDGATMTIDPTFMTNLRTTAPTQGFLNNMGNTVINTAPPGNGYDPPVLSADTTFSGLGNICYDSNRGHLLVTNFEDGKIWRTTTNGNVLDSFDPFMPDDGVSGFAPLGERIWGIQAFPMNNGETEVYFGVWSTDRRTESSDAPHNTDAGFPNAVWSVTIDAAGVFGTANMVYDIPDYNVVSKTGVNQPVSDIAISGDGLQMFWATRTMPGDVNQTFVGNTTGAHHSIFFYLERTTTTSPWSLPREVRTSNLPTFGNSAGGVDFAPQQIIVDSDSAAICDQRVWTTGDLLLGLLYGLQGFDIAEVNAPNPVNHTVSFFVDADRDLVNPAKTFMGDIEVFKCDCIDCQIFSTLMPAIQPDSTCCYTLNLSNISVSSQAASIQIDITNPTGVFFDQSSVVTAPGFNLNNYSPTSLTIDNNGGLLPNGNNNYLGFCFGNSSPTTVPNQTFTIKYFDLNGNELVECEQELTTDCELPPADEACVDVTAVSVECDSLYGHFKFTYQVTNLTSDQVLDNLDFTVVNPATGIILSATSNPIIAPIGPGQTSTDQCIGVYDFPPGNYPKQVDFIFSATGYHQSDSSLYCCHDRLDTLSIELPDCTNCIDVVDYNVYCDSLGDYYLDFCVENNSTPFFEADELDIAKLSSTPSWIGLSQYVWNNTNTMNSPFPLMSGESFCETVQIIGGSLADGDMLELEFRFNNIAQDSCCAEREILNLTLECCDYLPTLPQCDDCVESVQVVEYQGEEYVIYWADPLCSDAPTIVYDYCDGTEFCREGGLYNPIRCSDLMPSLIDNHIPGPVLWSKDTDCNTTCCVAPCEFFDRVNAPVLTNAPDLEGCDLSITTVALGDCDQVMIDWGDGTVDGPFAPGNVNLTHKYTAPGTYEVAMFVKEIGEDGNACWEGVSRLEVYAECVTKGVTQTDEVVFQNHPNPFTEQTTIEFTLPMDLPVTLSVFDSMGRRIATLLETELMTTGTHEIIFDGTDYPASVYYYTIQAGGFFGTQKMTLIR